jgi:hypothetical protein
MQVEERKAGRTSSTDTASAVPLRVIAGMPFAPGLNPFRDLELISELEHWFPSGKESAKPMT